jgi:hypothetical protein
VPLALMGVRCFWPHNTIGLEGLVTNQAWKLRSLFPVLSTRSSTRTLRAYTWNLIEGYRGNLVFRVTDRRV